MKLRELIRHLEKNGCRFVREGGSHTVFKNVSNGKMTTIPRHREIKQNLVRKICDDLNIKTPKTS